jgi:hypothetical protein
MKTYSVTALSCVLFSLSFAQGYGLLGEPHLYVDPIDTSASSASFGPTKVDLLIKSERQPYANTQSPCDSCIDAAQIKWFVDSVSLEQKLADIVARQPWVDGDGHLLGGIPDKESGMFEPVFFDEDFGIDNFGEYSTRANKYRAIKAAVLEEFKFYYDEMGKKVETCLKRFK